MARTTPKARRGRGEGGISFREDKGLWVARISLGFDGNGKRTRKSVYGETKNAVAEKLRKLRAEHDAGRLVDVEELTTRETSPAGSPTQRRSQLGSGRGSDTGNSSNRI